MVNAVEPVTFFRKVQEGNVSASEGPAYAPSWYTDTIVAAPERAALATSLDAEVCIIGAGLAGLTTARELALRGWSVAVIEARRIAWNASGRNTGFVLPGFAQDMDAVVRRVGLAHAKRLWELSEAGPNMCAPPSASLHARRRAWSRAAGSR